MPETVTVPSTLEGNAAETWRSTFLSAYDETCKERSDRDACAAAIAWSAVKNKYRKGEGGQWVAKAADPVLSPAAGSTEAAAGAPSVTPVASDPMLRDSYGTGAWKAAYKRALHGECRTAKDPEACARAAAERAVAAKGKAMNEAQLDRYRDYPLDYVQGREFSGEKREQLAKTGAALPGGRYPIETDDDVAQAVAAFGLAKPGTEGRVKAHVMSRARALNCMQAIPEEWKDTKSTRTSELFDGYLARTYLRLQASKSDLALLETRETVERPDYIAVDVWRSLPAGQKTVRAEALRRITERNYAQATEDYIMEGWDCFANPHAPDEFLFQRYMAVDETNRPALVRAVLIRSDNDTEWRLRPLTAFAGSSLSVALLPGEVRHQKRV